MAMMILYNKENRYYNIETDNGKFIREIIIDIVNMVVLCEANQKAWVDIFRSGDFDIKKLIICICITDKDEVIMYLNNIGSYQNIKLENLASELLKLKLKAL